MKPCKLQRNIGDMHGEVSKPLNIQIQYMHAWKRLRGIDFFDESVIYF